MIFYVHLWLIDMRENDRYFQIQKALDGAQRINEAERRAGVQTPKTNKKGAEEFVPELLVDWWQSPSWSKPSQPTEKDEEVKHKRDEQEKDEEVKHKRDEEVHEEVQPIEVHKKDEEVKHKKDKKEKKVHKKDEKVKHKKDKTEKKHKKANKEKKQHKMDQQYGKHKKDNKVKRETKKNQEKKQKRSCNCMENIVATESSSADSSPQPPPTQQLEVSYSQCINRFNLGPI